MLGQAIKKISIICFAIFFSACNQVEKKEILTSSSQVKLHYAKRFKIIKESGYTLLHILGDKKSDKFTATFVLYNHHQPKLSSDYFYVKTPVKNVASMSSIYTAMFEKLNAIDKITAIDNVDYYTNENIIAKVKSGTIMELSKGPMVDVERTLLLNPDLFLSFGMGNPKKDIDIKLLRAKIPTAICLDHLEETPLARAEWMKFIACFIEKEQVADSVFSAIETDYNELLRLTKTLTKRPSVLSEIKYGDAWYVPGGSSYMANLIKDAGGNYFWESEKQTGSIPLSFEMVYAKAKDCDVWINLYNVNTKQELAAYDERYKLFAAYENAKLYNNNKTQNSHGFSNYWETGISNPNKVLHDMIAILHPELFPNHQFTYYKLIQ